MVTCVLSAVSGVGVLFGGGVDVRARRVVAANLKKLAQAGFDRIMFVATSPTASVACQRAIEKQDTVHPMIELRTWLDFS